jgi:hypothetical protein
VYPYGLVGLPGTNQGCGFIGMAHDTTGDLAYTGTGSLDPAFPYPIADKDAASPQTAYYPPAWAPFFACSGNNNAAVDATTGVATDYVPAQSQAPPEYGIPNGISQYYS